MRTRTEVYEHYGWERCYHHRDSAEYHFNVKLNGNGRYRGYIDTIDQEAPNADHNRLYDITTVEEQLDAEWWWEEIRYELSNEYVVGYDVGPIYSCSGSRQGGWLQVSPNVERDADAMVAIGTYLTNEMNYWNSHESGQDLAQRVIEQYNAERLAELASPRPQRVEA